MAGEPAASKVDLTNCDREPIHVLGNIQPFGFLVVVGADWLISRVSANIGAFTGKGPGELVGAPLTALFTEDGVHSVRNRIAMLRGPDAVERLYRQSLIEGRPPFDVAVHLAGDAIVIEVEPASEDVGEAAGLVRTLVTRLSQTETLRTFISQSALLVRAITGFDRVMVYRFDDEGSGEVVAEALNPGVESFLGQRYPASDIPQQARKLYLRSVFRIIADIGATPVPIVPQLDGEGQMLDQSLSLLRAVSPIHIEYLKNMGVTASLSISIIVGGKLWGLFACHHYAPRLPNLAMRTAAELFGQMFSLMLESRERAETAEYEARARAATDRLMASVAQDDSLLQDAEWVGEVVFDTIPADGVAVLLNGAMSLHGLTPGAEDFRALVGTLNSVSKGEVLATDSIQAVMPAAAAYAEIAAGMIAIPLSRRPRDYVVLFRSEQLRSVRWGGNPEKAVETGPLGDRLTPRKSFEIWSQLVKGRSLPFTQSERRVAEALRIGILEVLVRLADSAGEERQRAAERQELLIAELNHRVRNILALIRGLVSQTREGTLGVEDFIANLDSRVQALARAHEQVTRDHWAPARLRDLIETEANAFLTKKRTQLKAEGPNVLIQPPAFTALALVFHELITNAVKYGALSDGGSVAVNWKLDEDGSLVIDWAESGGPPVMPPSRRGFGTVVIEQTIPHDLGGDARLHYQLGGLSAHFCIPSRHVAGVGSGEAISVAPPLPDDEARPLAGRRVMLVEDSLIIALDGEDVLRSLGAEEVKLAASVRGAMKLLDEFPLDLAVLDYNLGAENSEPIAEELNYRGIPFLFATGYGSGLDAARFASVPIVTKPYGKGDIGKAVAKLDAGP